MNNHLINKFALLIICCLTFFLNNALLPADLMESRNLATAQEMIRENNYLVPTMNGELRLEKPPLPTWIAAGIENILPNSLPAQRAAAGIMGILMVFGLYFLILELTKHPNEALMGAIILATSYNFVMMSRNATWDIYCHSFMLLALLSYIKGLNKKGEQLGRLALAGIFMGLSFLSKGPVSFYALLLPFLLAFHRIIKPSVKGKWKGIILMVFLCLIISFWWNIFLLLLHPEKFLSVIHQESSSWLNHNIRPWYYYYGFVAEGGIWAALWLSSIIYIFCNKKLRTSPYICFILTWGILTLILLSAMPEKKTRYLLPLLVPGAATIAIFLNEVSDMFRENKLKTPIIKLFKANIIFIAIILFCLPIAIYFMTRHKTHSISLFIAIILLFWMLSFTLFFKLRHKKNDEVKNIIFTISLAMVFTIACCIPFLKTIFINNEIKSIRNIRSNKEIYDTYPFYYPLSSGTIRMELIYELNKTVPSINLQDSIEITKKLPFILINPKSNEIFKTWKHIKITSIEEFDNNWKHKQHKRYNPDLNIKLLLFEPKNN